MADVPESGTQSKEGCTGIRHTKEKNVPESGT